MERRGLSADDHSAVAVRRWLIGPRRQLAALERALRLRLRCAEPAFFRFQLQPKKGLIVAREPTGMILGHDTPLRLDSAAKIAFPDGGMTAAGLRREWKRGRLVIERVAGKDFTTLNHIERMREQCRVEQSRPDYGKDLSAATSAADSPTPQPGSFLMADDNLILESVLTTLARRSAHSQTT